MVCPAAVKEVTIWMRCMSDDLLTSIGGVVRQMFKGDLHSLFENYGF